MPRRHRATIRGDLRQRRAACEVYARRLVRRRRQMVVPPNRMRLENTIDAGSGKPFICTSATNVAIGPVALSRTGFLALQTSAVKAAPVSKTTPRIATSTRFTRPPKPVVETSSLADRLQSVDQTDSGCKPPVCSMLQNRNTVSSERGKLLFTTSTKALGHCADRVPASLSALLSGQHDADGLKDDGAIE